MTDDTSLPTNARPWDGFLVGEENSLAHAASLALAGGEIEGISPLVVHGPSGCGKTRLLAGLVAETIARRPSAAVASISADEFATECAEAAESRSGFAELRDRFRRLDLLAIDDLPGIARSPLATEELGHTLDELEKLGAAVAVTAKDPPARWISLPQRLVARLTGGLSVRIEPPGLASRRRFVLERARRRGVRFPVEAIETLAAGADDYRVLDGLITQAALRAKVEGRPADVSELVSPDLIVDRKARAEAIAWEVAAKFGVTLRDLRSASRRQTLVVPRHLAIYRVRQETGMSFAQLGQFFGKRDTKTVRHACQAAERRIAADPSLLE